MATVHYENGKYHVHNEIVDNAKKETSQKQLPSAKKENPANDHTSFLQKETTTISSALNLIFQIPVSTALQYNYLPGDYPPPRA